MIGRRWIGKLLSVIDPRADAQLRIHQYRRCRILGIESFAQVRQKHHWKFQSLGLVDRHNAHRAAHGSRLGADALFTQAIQVAKEARQAVVFAAFVAVGQAEEPLEILQTLGTALHSAENRTQEQPLVDGIQQSAQRRSTGKVTERIELPDKFGGLGILADSIVNAALPVPCPCQSQIIGGKTEHRREQYGQKRDILPWIVDDLQQSRQNRDLVRDEDIVAAADTSDAAPLQRGFIDVLLAAWRAHQNDNVLRRDRAEGLAVGDRFSVSEHGGNTFCHKLRLDVFPVEVPVCRDFFGVDAVKLHRGRIHSGHLPLGTKGLPLTIAKPADPLGHRHGKDIVGGEQNLVIGAEIVGKQDLSRLSLSRRRIICKVPVLFQE